MKKYIFSFFLLSLFILFGGCEKDFDNVIDAQNTSYKISNIASFNSFFYTSDDSLILLRITFLNDDEVNSVNADVIASDGEKLNVTPLFLFDNGNQNNGDASANDNTYSAVFPLSQINPNGKYSINYFITDKSGITKKAASHYFEYDNGQANVAPILTLLQMADTIAVGETIIFSVLATDENGSNDIKFIFYETFNPEGIKVVNTGGISQFPLFDDGNTQGNGDAVAGDNRYSVRLTFPATAQKGIWRFEFQAKDRRNFLSNKIIHYIEVL